VFMPIFALPLSAHLIVTVADHVPKIDVRPSCRGAVTAKVTDPGVNAMQHCLAIEKKAHETLVKEWRTFTAADQTKCADAVSGFSPTYTELLTCLEFSRELSKKQ
jgi:hypothetical protein